MVPQLQLYKSLILAKQKELITGVTQAPTIEHQDLPRQNNDRENAILGAQGQSKSSDLFSKFLKFSKWKKIYKVTGLIDSTLLSRSD